MPGTLPLFERIGTSFVTVRILPSELGLGGTHLYSQLFRRLRQEDGLRGRGLDGSVCVCICICVCVGGGIVQTGKPRLGVFRN